MPCRNTRSRSRNVSRSSAGVWHSRSTPERLREHTSKLCRVLNQVEDELTTIPFHPDNYQTDGRLYPPQPDSMRAVDGRPEITRFRSRAHNTFIGANGSIEIRAVASKDVVFSKPGSDGRGVWDQ